jgi:hypothetical protein
MADGIDGPAGADVRGIAVADGIPVARSLGLVA